MTERLIVEEHTALDGFVVGKLLSVSDESALYETEYADAPHRTVLLLRQGDTEGTEHRLALWQEAVGLSHPNLLRLHAAGSSVLNDIPVIYAVVERADESLAEVLSGRTLSHDEAREIMQPALSALAYLHKSGYTMAGLEPSKIGAVGDSLKLSADALERRGEGGEPADDMHDFGVLLMQATNGSVSEDAVVKHCLDTNSQTRWTAEQALASLRPEVEQRAVPDTKPIREEVSSGVSSGVFSEVSSGPPADRRRSVYVAVAAVLFAVALIGAFAWHKSTPAQAPAIAPAVPAVASAAAENPAPLPVPEKPQPIAPRGDRRSNSWVVVIASYGARVPAEKRVREIAKRWPAFHVELLEAASEKARLLVVIGKNLTEKEAEALRGRARSAGLPRDTYIKRIGAGNG